MTTGKIQQQQQLLSPSSIQYHHNNGYQTIQTPSSNDQIEKRIMPSFRQQRRPIQLQQRQSQRASSSHKLSRSSRSSEADHRTILKLFLSTCFILTVLFVFNRFLYLWSYVHESLSIEDATKLIKEIPSTEHIQTYITSYATHRLAGTEHAQALANWTFGEWQQMGIHDIHIETFYPTLNQPSYYQISILDHTSRVILEYSHHQQTLTSPFPPFHGYSANGNVTGPVVYVNYGQESDYLYLQTKGVNFTGTIALIRHDNSGNGGGSDSSGLAAGTQVALAEQHGCKGALIYADPGDDDGPARKWNPDGEPEQAYPLGPWRPSTSVPQASVMNMAMMIGDPWTPGVPMKNGTINNNHTYALPGIPSLPLSWQQVIPLLQLTTGLGVPANVNWRGGDDANHTIDFSSGPSVLPIQLVNINTYSPKPIHNIVARIPGQKEPNRAVIIGCQRDAWSTSGVVESASSSAIMHELVRTLGLLLQQGWRPRRTIILASWDASAYGALGSTEWVESHKDWISKEVVAYIDVGSVAGSRFNAQGSPLLHELLYEVTQDLFDPQYGPSTIYDTWKRQRQSSAISHCKDITTTTLQKEQTTAVGGTYDPTVLVDPLRVSDDGSALFHHLGVSTLSLQFESNHFGVAYSEQDNLDWMAKFGDPTFAYHQTMVRLMGILALRLSSERLLPMTMMDYSVLLLQYTDELSARQGCQTLPALTTSLLILQSTSVVFDRKANKYRQQLVTKKHYSKKLKKHVRQYNQAMINFERSLVDPLGLPGRNWYRHVVYGPHPLHPASPLMFPAIAQAMHEDRPIFTRQMEERVASKIMAANSAIKF
ncbi:uncharacterized protein BX664DRAFT_341628 [Halteromyces radiatus]|uniref:uncharacterized protein n=1 Tax=Halteromyces radiatus TaxID=101107 RepID=UPI00221E7363|nr:uncharacterized protein BX664DRAFT_341628 [Halteromyces radiatus]KAI8079859.1 hypothetical protein BX664DRAFT_341628 [Halteromyces radiatus]